MALLQPKLETRPAQNQYCLLEDYGFEAVGTPHAIPAGCIFNGASVPWTGWIPTYTPFRPDVMAAAIVHDWLYAHHHLSRKGADLLFYIRLIHNGASPVKAKLMYMGVRLFGWLFYPKNGN